MKLEHHPDRNAIVATATGQGWLAGRDSAATEEILAIARVKNFQADEIVFAAGDPAEAVFGLIRGSVEVLIPRPDGEELAVHRAETGFWVGDLPLLSGHPNLVTVRTGMASQMLVLTKADVFALLERRPALYRDFFELTRANVATTISLLGTISIPNSESRIILRLLQLEKASTDPEGWLHISQQKLCQLVALSPATLQRCLRQLRDRGLVKLAYGRLKLLDRPGLEQRCAELAGQ